MPATDAVFDQLGQAARWLARTGWRVTRGLPGGELAERRLLDLETTVVEGIRRRLEPDGVVTLVRPVNGHVEPLRAGMAELLNRSANADAARATGYLHSMILRQLVPDEARILAALADGVPRPAVDVVVRTTLGGVQRTVLRNASAVGRQAGVSAPDYVPAYLTRLYRMGVVDIGDEDPALAEQYDILLTDPLVRDAEDLARKARKGAARIVRHTVMISDLGGRFWSASDPIGRPSG
jgi:Abortive infection alpha